MFDNEEGINSLIPVAKKETTQKVALLGKESEKNLWSLNDCTRWDFWTECFDAAMRSMAIEEGVNK